MKGPVFRTSLCEMLKIEYPILLAGMGSRGLATPPALVAAVSEAVTLSSPYCAHVFPCALGMTVLLLAGYYPR